MVTTARREIETVYERAWPARFKLAVSVALLLQLLLFSSTSLAHRYGAREESCYNHTIEHVQEGDAEEAVVLTQCTVDCLTVTISYEIKRDTLSRDRDAPVSGPELNFDTYYEGECGVNCY